MPSSQRRLRQQTSMVKPGGITLLQVPGRQLAASQTFTGCLIFQDSFCFLFCDGSCGEQKAQEEEDRAAGNQAKVKPWAGWGEGGWRWQLHSGTASRGLGVRSSVYWNLFSSRRRWAQPLTGHKYTSVTSSEWPGWAFHSDVCVPQSILISAGSWRLRGWKHLCTSQIVLLWFSGLHPIGTINGLLSNYLNNFWGERCIEFSLNYEENM